MRIVKTKYKVKAITSYGNRELLEIENLGEVSSEALFVPGYQDEDGKPKVIEVTEAEGAEAAFIRATARLIEQNNRKTERIKLAKMEDGEECEITLQSLQS